MDAPRSPYLVVLTTVGSEDDAKALVRALVDGRHVACGTILPGATSVYRWQGSVAEESEVLVVLKTAGDRWETLERAVQRLHPYDVPELVALPVTAGLEAYLEWVSTETRTEGRAS